MSRHYARLRLLGAIATASACAAWLCTSGLAGTITS